MCTSQHTSFVETSRSNLANLSSLLPERVRVVGVPVVDGYPIEARAQVGFHAAHQVPRVGAQVFQLGAVLGREDEAEMVPVVGTAFLEGVEVGGIGLRSVGLTRLAIAAYAIALDVAQVLGERLRA